MLYCRVYCVCQGEPFVDHCGCGSHASRGAEYWRGERAVLYLSHSFVVGPLFLQLILPVALSYCGVDMALYK